MGNEDRCGGVGRIEGYVFQVYFCCEVFVSYLVVLIQFQVGGYSYFFWENLDVIGCIFDDYGDVNRFFCEGFDFYLSFGLFW